MRTQLVKLPREMEQVVKQMPVPIVYEEAVKALVACREIDEVKYWNTKAEVLAAWAKIHRSKQAELEARRLKLHAYRRMGQLAEELRPTRACGNPGSEGRTRGARSLLMEHGLTKNNATFATQISRIPDTKFTSIVNSDRPAGVGSAAIHGMGRGKNKPPAISGVSYRTFSNGIAAFASLFRRNSARDLAKGMSKDEAKKCKAIVVELTNWLGEFEDNLPKS